jgi:hypothetical protein
MSNLHFLFFIQHAAFALHLETRAWFLGWPRLLPVIPSAPGPFIWVKPRQNTTALIIFCDTIT